MPIQTGLGELITVRTLHDAIEVEIVTELASTHNLAHAAIGCHTKPIDVDLEDRGELLDSHELFGILLTMLLMIVLVLTTQNFSLEEGSQSFLKSARCLQMHREVGKGLFACTLVIDVAALDNVLLFTVKEVLEVGINVFTFDRFLEVVIKVHLKL